MRKPVVNVAVQAARNAGKVILRSLSKLDSLKVEEKSRMDFSTEVDRAAEAEILKELRKAYPDHSFLAEESGEHGKSSRFQWVIDPLDGTSNYTRGFPFFAVSIALVEAGVPIAGVVYNPLTEELFTAHKGSGAFLNDKRIRVSGRQSVAGTIIGTGFSPRQRDKIKPHFEILSNLMASAEDIRRTGSAALDLAFVACGRTDAFFEFGLKPWDMAAGILLVREAGGLVVDFNGDENFMESGNVIAGNLKVASQMVQTVKGVMAKNAVASDSTKASPVKKLVSKSAKISEAS
jgi:myo-inositol-1(or 4)-monophosphatase